jgi:hypothetical protein
MDKIKPPTEFFVVDSKALWHGADGWYSCDVSDHSDDETPSGQTETIIRWADADVIDPDDADDFEGIAWLVRNTGSWLNITNGYAEAKSRKELARFEELVAHSFGGIPIGKIGPLDVLGHWGVHFEIGGHSWVVFRTLDVPEVFNLGLQLTCNSLDGHEGCEDQWATLIDGYRFRGGGCDLYVQRFIRETIIEFTRDGAITKREFPRYNSVDFFGQR